MKAYKSTLDDIIKLRKELSMENKVSPSIKSGVTQSGSFISKSNSSLKRAADQNIIGLLGHHLQMKRILRTVIDEKRKYSQVTVKLIEVEIKPRGEVSNYVLYERVFFRGNKHNETFTFDKIAPLSKFADISMGEIITRLEKEQSNNIELAMERPVMTISSKTIHPNNDQYYFISFNKTTGLEFKISPSNLSGIYLDYHYSIEEIDGFFEKEHAFAVHQLLQDKNEVEILKEPDDNYASNKLLVSVKGHANFGEAFKQIIKHYNHLKWLDELKLETKLPFLLICHSDFGRDDVSRSKSFSDSYSHHQKNMNGISLTVIYLKTQKFFSNDYLLSHDSLKDVRIGEKNRFETKVDNLDVKKETVRTEVALAVKTEIAEAEKRIVESVKTEVAETVKTEVSTQLQAFFKQLEKSGFLRKETKDSGLISKKRNRDESDDDYDYKK